MLKFLLWNLNKKPLAGSIAKLARKHDIDVLVLLENDISPSHLLPTLNPPGTSDYYFSPGLCERVHLYTRFIPEFSSPVYESGRLTIRHLKLPGRTDLILAATHFQSKTYWSDDSQLLECAKLADEIKEVERDYGHTRTVLIGDLNMNPFEAGIISAGGLNATMSRRISQKRKRRVQSREYPYFYNPMWGLFSNGSVVPEATYYYDNTEHKVQFWHMFDQVLLRPDLISAFRHDDLKILQSDGDLSLLNRNGIPDKRRGSDHLPLLFTLDI